MTSFPYPLALSHWMLDEPITKTIERIAQAGLQAIELNGEPDDYDPGEVKELLELHGLTAWGGVTLMVHEGRSMIHRDRFMRLGTRAYVRETVDLISSIGGSVLTCVPTSDITIPTNDHRREWRDCVEELRVLADYAGERQVRIALEPINRYETYFLNRAEQALEMVSDVDCPNLGVCLDTYHMNIEEDDPVSAILSASTYLYDFHIADSNRKPPGEGVIDWVKTLDALGRTGYDGALTIEVEIPADPDIESSGSNANTSISNHFTHSIARIPHTLAANWGTVRASASA